MVELLQEIGEKFSEIRDGCPPDEGVIADNCDHYLLGLQREERIGAYEVDGHQSGFVTADVTFPDMLSVRFIVCVKGAVPARARVNAEGVFAWCCGEEGDKSG